MRFPTGPFGILRQKSPRDSERLNTVRDEAMTADGQSEGGQSHDAGASDSSASRTARLSALTTAALRCAVAAPPREQGQVGEALRRVCELAHQQNLRAEEVLIALKTGWRQLPEAQSMGRVEADAALRRVITLCIDEYYKLTPRQ